MSAELAFELKASSKGWQLVRDGWPDYLVTDPATGDVFWVEVKAATDSIRQSQKLMFATLERLGIKVRIWCPAMPDALMDWRQFAPRKREHLKHKRLNKIATRRNFW